ncbi:MAG: ribonuclease J [Candidatus Spechtbacterales bacterium]|nr:ribonuclease J [Candidatus Spechtbacterales bacterium]
MTAQKKKTSGNSGKRKQKPSGKNTRRGKKKPELRIIPLGGLEEVGRNMTLFEYENKVLIVDMGLQFPEEDMPGIDYIIPNISYLTENKNKEVVGVVITHGHMDHFGALPHLVPKLGNPPVFGTKLTNALIKKRLSEYPNTRGIKVNEFDKNDKLNLSPFKLEFFHVNHNIPDSVGVVIDTPAGRIMHTGDFKFDHSPVGDDPADIARIVELAKPGVDVLLEDSTNAESPGYTISESEVEKNLEEIVKLAEGRVIAATFGSLTTRVQELINIAERQGRYVALDGYSMRTNYEIAKELGYVKAKKGTIVSMKELKKYPDKKMLIICTGAQGEDRAVLMRIANKEHRHIQLQKGDSVIFSSSVVPGNERSVQSLKDVIMMQGAKIFHSKLMDIHASGHAQEEDLKLMLNLVKPKNLIPIHGHRYMLQTHAEVAEFVGMSPKNIAVVENGRVMNLTPNGNLAITKERVPTHYVMVDGLGIGDVGQIVLRDRQVLSEDGMVVVISVVDGDSGKVKGNPDIISRGFVYLRESKPLLAEIRKKTKAIVEHATSTEQTANWDYVKDTIREDLGKLLYKKTERRPMVLPVIIVV